VDWPNTDFGAADDEGALSIAVGKKPNGLRVIAALVTVGGEVLGGSGASSIGLDEPPNTELEVEDDGNADLPNIDDVLKTLGVDARPENTDTAGVMSPVMAGEGDVDVSAGENSSTTVDVVGLDPKVVDDHSIVLGLRGGAVPGALTTCPSSSTTISESECSAAPFVKTPSSPDTEIPSMISGIDKSPRIASISSMVSFPNNRSRIQATRYIMTTLPCSLRTAASSMNICMHSSSTTRGEILLIGALLV
jgi:hypothetical protein